MDWHIVFIILALFFLSGITSPRNTKGNDRDVDKQDNNVLDKKKLIRDLEVQIANTKRELSVCCQICPTYHDIGAARCSTGCNKQRALKNEISQDETQLRKLRER